MQTQNNNGKNNLELFYEYAAKIQKERIDQKLRNPDNKQKEYFVVSRGVAYDKKAFRAIRKNGQLYLYPKLGKKIGVLRTISGMIFVISAGDNIIFFNKQAKTIEEVGYESVPSYGLLELLEI